VGHDSIGEGEAQIVKLSLLSFKEIKQLLWGIFYIHSQDKPVNECMLNKAKNTMQHHKHCFHDAIIIPLLGRQDKPP
jgi:hypothetical protein